MPEEEIAPSICPELSSNVIQTILEINAGLIKVCVEFQNKGWTSDPDFAIYQARLQSNLAFLAAVADHYLKPERKLTELPPKPNLTPLPDPRTVSAEMLKKLVAKARHDFEGVDTSSLPQILQRDTESGKCVERDIKDREQNSQRTLVLERSHEHVKLPVPQSKRILDPPISSEQFQTYQPFPPIQLPDGIPDPLVPPILPKVPTEIEDEDESKSDASPNNDSDQNQDNIDLSTIEDINLEIGEELFPQDAPNDQVESSPIGIIENQTTEQLDQQSESNAVPPVQTPEKPQISLISELIEQINGQPHIL